MATGGPAPVAPTAPTMAGATGLEPATSGVTGRRSNQLSYTPATADRGDTSYLGAPGVSSNSPGFGQRLPGQYRLPQHAANADSVSVRIHLFPQATTPANCVAQYGDGDDGVVSSAAIVEGQLGEHTDRQAALRLSIEVRVRNIGSAAASVQPKSSA